MGAGSTTTGVGTGSGHRAGRRVRGRAGATLAGVALVLAMLLLAIPRQASATATATALPLEIRRFATIDADVRLDRIVSGAYDAQFLPVPGDAVRLAGGVGYTHWLKLTARLPEGETASDWVLRVDRSPVQRMIVYVARPGGPPLELTRRFFLPDPGEGFLSSAFTFPLPAGQGSTVVLYASVDTRMQVSLAPALLSRQAFHREDRATTNLLSAIYSAILVLALSSLALWLAMRESAYLYFVGFTAGLLLWLGAGNGHLYALPGLGMLAWWGPFGLLALSFACCAMLLGLTQKFVELRRLHRRADRSVDIGRWLLLLMAALCLLNLRGFADDLQPVAALAWVATVLAAAAISGYAARRGQQVARALALTWLLIGGAVAARALLTLGWVTPGFWTLYGWQLVIAVGTFLLSIGLADRVMEFRKQRDRARLAKEQTDASLQVEQRRRELVEGLRESLRTTPAGDLEWIAFRKMLATLRPLVPQSGSAVIAFGYHGLDLLLAEPAGLKERFSQLLAARGGNIRGICRGRTSLQVRLEHAAPDVKGAAGADGGVADKVEGMFAIVPLPMPKPGWGAVIVERPTWEEFDADEIRLIAEFAQITTKAADEAASQADLRRRADLDPLTGAFNRRGGDQALEEMLASALDRRLPLSVMIVDLDHFKQFNERHGNEAGDEALRRTGEAIRRLLQPGDVLARYGGEEFLVVLAGRQPDQARQLGERIREAVGQIVVRTPTAVAKLTASIGVAGRGGAEETPGPLLERVERAMQAAKRNGRNQVQVAPAYGGYGGSDAEASDGLVL